MPLELSRLSRDYIYFNIDTANDLSLSQGEVTFLLAGELPIEVDWNAADIIDEVGTWVLRVLVGPNSGTVTDSIDLTPPSAIPVDYQAWIRITDHPERPVRRPGIVTIE